MLLRPCPVPMHCRLQRQACDLRMPLTGQRCPSPHGTVVRFAAAAEAAAMALMNASESSASPRTGVRCHGKW